MNPRDRPYIGSLKNILEKFYEEPLDRFFILCGEGGGSDQFPYYELYHWVYFGASSKIMALHGSL
jgi:hypothetical protein